MLRVLRKGFLLYIFVLIAAGNWMTQHRLASWENSLWVGVYPINGDGSEVSARYIDGLTEEDFQALAEYMAAEAARFGVTHNRPVTVVLLPEVAGQPPMPPRSDNMLQVMLWSLKLRWWAWNMENDEAPAMDVSLFVRYFDPGRTKSVEHSLGLQKGRIGIVNAFASRRYRGSNRVVIAHELLHTLGATDKYDLATGLPVFPEGYAEPELAPLHPQRVAELMGGRIPVSRLRAEIPGRLSDTLIGPLTAKEIGWRQ